MGDKSNFKEMFNKNEDIYGRNDSQLISMITFWIYTILENELLKLNSAYGIEEEDKHQKHHK